MSFISDFKDNRKYKEKYNTEHLKALTLEAENKRLEIIIDELKEAVSSVRKIWMDANNEKELRIVELNEEIKNLKAKSKKTKEAVRKEEDDDTASKEVK